MSVTPPLSAGATALEFIPQPADVLPALGKVTCLHCGHAWTKYGATASGDETIPACVHCFGVLTTP